MACIGALCLAGFQFAWYLHQLLQCEGITHDKFMYPMAFFLMLQDVWRLLECYVWLVPSRLMPSPNPAAWKYHSWPFYVSNRVHSGASGCIACIRLLCLSTLHGIALDSQHSRRISSCVSVCEQARERLVANETQWVWARVGGRGGKHSKWFIHVQQGGAKSVRHENHWGCILSAPNSLLKQIQLQVASKLAFVTKSGWKQAPKHTAACGRMTLI